MSVKLRDICTFQSGGTPSKKEKRYFNGTIPWVTTVALNNGMINGKDANELITEDAIRESAAKIVPANSIMVGTRVGVGKVAINLEKMSTSQDIFSLIGINENIWSKEYICKFLQAKKGYLNSQARGATIKGIKIEILENLILPENSLEDQKEISLIIDRVNGIIEIRKKELKKLDEIVNARFMELFGDPLLNPKGWSLLPLKAVCQNIYGGGTPSKGHPEYFEGQIPWVSPKDMKMTVIQNSIDHITKEAIENSTTNLIPEHSVLMVIRSGILKHTLPVAINNVEVTINQDMKAFVPGKTIKAEYLMYYFKAIERDILSGVRSVTADNIDFKAFQKRMIIVPSLEVQEKFVDFVKEIEKSKIVCLRILQKKAKFSCINPFL